MKILILSYFKTKYQTFITFAFKLNQNNLYLQIF